MHDTTQRNILKQAGMTWDSSISEQWGTTSASPDAEHRV